MAFDQATRNRLSKFVSDTRKLLSDEFAQQMRVKYGLDPANGVVTDIDKLPTMAEGDRQTAQMLRDTLEHYLATAPKRDKKTVATTIDRIVREQAFTVLNRLCAVRMAESRDLVIESIAQGTKSKGFQLYARLAGSALGETGEAYVCYLFSLFDELSIDLPVLFDRFSPSGRLFPRESVLLDVLGQINHHELQHLWAEDETIGWIYQYFNSDEERKAMRDVKAGGSAAPRNSRELAVRNQFFTPRYVVEFLTDNTLGRIWYEMTQGQTRLVDECKYLVRRPDEVFLSHVTSKDQEHPSEGTIAMADLLLSGTEETFPEFNARDPQPMIELAHCVSAYTTMGDRAHDILGNRTLMVREWSVHEPAQVVDAVEAAPYVFAGQPGMLKTQHILEVLFMTCRSDRHGGDGSVYSEPWFVNACNEVRRRVLNSRRDDLSQDELLRQPAFIPYRPLKDPRDIKMLDPACGSMHFGLYAFDLFLAIYDEAWELEERLGDRALSRPRELTSLRASYQTRESYKLDVPRLVIERNIHGIDIDARAVQIAGLSLWLRAQKAWHEAGIKPNTRPQITRSNIVCAEPMPGGSYLLEQFISEQLSETSEHQTIASIVRRVFDAMKLAGEAGSLLRIEEEVAGTIEEAKKKWIEGPKALQLPLFAIDEKQKDSGGRPLLVAGIDDALFWDEIEDRIYAALREYGEKVGGGLQRRLFANDATQGFAFIDLCRQRYDVALMNPPFGDHARQVFDYMGTAAPNCKRDVLCAFIEISLSRLSGAGALGAITKREPLFTGGYEIWRKANFFESARIAILCDLGGGVLDNAMVETSTYVVNKDRGSKLIGVGISGEAGHSEIRRVIDHQTISRIPGWPLSLNVPQCVLKAFDCLCPLEPAFGKTAQGAGTTDDFRFCRLWFEVPAARLRLFSKCNDNFNDLWVPYAKGEPAVPFFGDVPVVLKWGNNGAEVKEYNRMRYGSASRNITNESFYGHDGIVFPRRTSFFKPRILPKECIFSKGGQTVFSTSSNTALLGLLSSPLIEQLIRPMLGREDMAPQYEVGIVSKIPLPDLVGEREEIELLVTPLIRYWRTSFSTREESSYYVATQLTSYLEYASFSRSYWREASSSLKDNEKRLRSKVNEVFFSELGVQLNEEDRGVEIYCPSEQLLATRFLNRCLSNAFQIYDDAKLSSYADFDRVITDVDDPISLCPDALVTPELSLSMLPCDECDVFLEKLGVSEEDTAHLASALSLTEEAFRSGLNDHLFEAHLKLFSGHGRQAPIYWPLTTAGGDYTIWVNYHRLTDQTLFTAVNDHIDPKLKRESESLNALRVKSGRTQEDENRVERLVKLVSDLEDFRSELLRVGKLWKPNLNDGAQITAAPLWGLFSVRKWRELLRETWAKLEVGEYDWSHLSLAFWPERVIHVAREDRSIAIAHDLEDELWHEIEVKKMSKAGRVTTKIEWQPRELSEKQLEAIIQRVKNGEFVSASGEDTKS
jgi:hypothetical protein